MMPLRTNFHNSVSLSITRLSVKNSFRYLRTAAGVAASGVPRLTSSTPTPGGTGSATAAGVEFGTAAGFAASVAGDGAIGGGESEAAAGFAVSVAGDGVIGGAGSGAA